MDNTTHNLDINTYSFKEILDLFGLDPNCLTIESLKIAKKKVLMMHPDKSNLDSDYFLFYTNALKRVIQYFKEINKQNQEITSENTEYENIEKPVIETNIKNKVNNIEISDFNKWFNDQFENNMKHKNKTKKYDWFKDMDPVLKTDAIYQPGQINDQLQKIKQNNKELIKYTGVENITYNNGSNIYDDDDENTIQTSYVSSDIFGKLKYDDLRKVHKDQTVFAVSENDIHNVKKYNSMDHLIQERGMNSKEYIPIEKKKGEELFKLEEQQRKEYFMNKQHKSNLKTDEFENKNKKIISAFLNLTN